MHCDCLKIPYTDVKKIIYLTLSEVVSLLMVLASISQLETPQILILPSWLPLYAVLPLWPLKLSKYFQLLFYLFHLVFPCGCYLGSDFHYYLEFCVNILSNFLASKNGYCSSLPFLLL